MSKWSRAVSDLFDANGGQPVSFASLAEASKYDERMTHLKDKFHVDKLEVETNVQHNKPIDLTSPSKPVTLERVRELKMKLSAGLDYSARTSTGRRFEVERTPKREDSQVFKAYGSVTKLDYSLR